jgi:hypothetical protein
MPELLGVRDLEKVRAVVRYQDAVACDCIREDLRVRRTRAKRFDVYDSFGVVTARAESVQERTSAGVLIEQQPHDRDEIWSGGALRRPRP